MGNEIASDSLNPHNNGSKGGGNSTISYTKIFYEHLPYYLSIGMSWEQYWEQDVCMVKYFREADEIRKRRINEQLWLQGMYVYNAIVAVSPVLVPFAKNPKPQPYTKEPFPITKQMQEEKEKERYIKMLNYMKAFASNNKNE